jgi:hypothetical protein
MPEEPTKRLVLNAEQIRLEEAREQEAPWKKWGGPYLSERQWGTVREDYSENGDAWNFFTHDHARSRAYRWGEDGIAGISDDKQRLCFALALLEWAGPNPEGTALRPHQQRRQPRRGCERVLLLSRQHADPLVHEVPLQVPAGGLSLLRPGGDKPSSHHDMEYELLDTGVFKDDLGGHSQAGYTAGDGGVVIDLSRMKKIRVDAGK